MEGGAVWTQDANPDVTQPDICAWYQPIHFHGLDWGIFIKEACLLRLAIDISSYAQFRPRTAHDVRVLAKAAIRAGFATLFLHEQFHHKTESYALRLHGQAPGWNQRSHALVWAETAEQILSKANRKKTSDAGHHSIACAAACYRQ